MAYAIARTILRRAEECGRLSTAIDEAAPLLVPGGEGLERRIIKEIERPPMDVLRTSIEALPAAAAR
jgi:hypothetical protein